MFEQRWPCPFGAEMRREQTTGDLRDFGERLFGVVQDFAGKAPELLPDGTWYRAKAGGKAFVNFRLIGEEAGTSPPNSVHLATQWNEVFREEDEEVTEGNNWYGSLSAELAARANDPDGLFRAQRFIFHAFALYGGLNEQLLAAITRKTGQPSSVVVAVIEALVKVAAEFLARDGRQAIKVPGLVTIEAYGVPAITARSGINATTKEPMEIPGAPARTRFRARFAPELSVAVGLKEAPSFGWRG
jgi:hypothetical protein